MIYSRKNNVILYEADNFIVEDFKEIFSLDKFVICFMDNGSK